MNHSFTCKHCQARLPSVVSDNTCPECGGLLSTPGTDAGLEAATIKPVARWHSFRRPAASFAVAASVFASVLVGSQFYGLMGLQNAQQGSAAAAQMATRASPVGLVNTLGGAAVTASYATPAIKSAGAGQRSTYNHLAHQRLQRYLLPHAEEAALNAPQGMMPYARVSAWQVEE